MPHDVYENPLGARYASRVMSEVWSDRFKFSTWRRIWTALAEAQHELGLPVSRAQVEELRAAIDDVDFARAADYERKLRHDVMAHVHAYRDRCPGAGGIIHLGATSCEITDNAELIQIRAALQIIRRRLVQAIDRLAAFATAERDTPCLGMTHLQPAQPTTVGKRAALWCHDLVLDLVELEHRLRELKFRGVKGTTGTQATFLQLLNGDHAKVLELERRVARKLEFDAVYPVTGQTYSRKVDAQLVEALSGVAQSLHKLGSDLRILQSFKELEEPYETQQIGSSAMAYKRNPMRAERMCALARFVMSLAGSAADTAAVQWMERTLDDSANRRLVLPQAFLGVDACLILVLNIVEGLVVNRRVIARRLEAELPFMATEEVLMAGVQAGGDRQELHERIRVHSQAAAREVKESGKDNDLLARLRADEAFAGVDLTGALDARKYIGRAPEQVDEFVAQVVGPLRLRFAADLGAPVDDVRV